MQEKKDFLFRFVETTIRDKLQLDAEASYSTTDQLTADKITRDLAKILPKTSTITDATACIGGNTYSFAQAFQTVIAIERDHTRAQMLKTNMTLLGMKNVRVKCGDAVQVVPTTHHDLIFLDPPWGGPEYKQQVNVSLCLSNRPLSDVCSEFANYTKYIALKVPVNFDEPRFLQDTKNALEIVHRNAQLRKMKLLVFKTKLWQWNGSSIHT